MIGQTISHYHILGHIGEGAMGVVYVAEDVRLGRRVAVKFPIAGADEKNYRARFLREARAVSSITHKNIAAVYDCGETTSGKPFIVMELVHGQTLSDILNGPGLSITRAVEIIEDVADALAAAHRRGVVHRDVKPGNVIVDERGDVKVLDFGLAKQFDEELGPAVSSAEAQALLAMKTRSDVIIGTPLYLSPEQARGGKIDGRSDLFALGSLLYECVAGRPAFSGESVIEIGAQVLHVDPPPPSKFNSLVPSDIDRVCQKALAKDVTKRYQSAEEMIGELQRARAKLPLSDTTRTRRLATQPGGMRSSALMTLSERLRRPRLSPLAFLAALAIILVGIWGFAYLRKPSAHKPTAEAVKVYESGVDALRAGAFYKASEDLQSAVKLDPQFALAHARLAEAWSELDYPDRAKDMLLVVQSMPSGRDAFTEQDALYLDAVLATVRREYSKASATYEEIAKRNPNSPQAQFDLGRAYEKEDLMEKAVAAYTQASTLDPEYAVAYVRLGVLYGRQGNMPAALGVYERAEKLYAKAGNQEGLAEVFLRRGMRYLSQDKPAEARTNLEEAYRLAETVGNQSQRINSMLQLSFAATYQNDIPRAERLAQEAVDTAQAHGMQNLAARGLVDLGNVYFVKGDDAKTEKYFSQALDIAQRSGARLAAANALLSLGSLRTRQGKPNEAVNYINQAVPFYEQANYRNELSKGLLVLGRAQYAKGDYESARRAFEQQLQLAEQMGNQSLIGYSHEGIGTVFHLQEKYPEALRHFDQKYLISKAIGVQGGTGWGLAERASALWPMGRYEEAKNDLKQATVIAGTGYKSLLVNITVTQAEIALSERRFGEARAHARRAMSLSDAQLSDDIVTAKRVLCWAEALSLSSTAVKSCEEALVAANQTGNPGLISSASVALAHAQLENGNFEGALKNALSSQESFSRSGRLASDWLAWLVASRASLRAGDQTNAREYASRATASLDRIRQQWGDAPYNSYLSRPDVQHYRAQLALN